jgi:hypothetical protein
MHVPGVKMTRLQKVLAVLLVGIMIPLFQNCSGGFKASNDATLSSLSSGSQKQVCPVSAVSATPFGTYVASGTASGPALTVDAAQGLYPISRDIFGVNTGGDQSLATELKTPVQRWGGDATSRYNWKVDSSNSGFDWYFMGGSGTATPTQNGQITTVINLDHASSSKTVLTLPMVGYLTSASLVTSANPQGLITDGVLTGRTISGTVGYVNASSSTNCSYPVSLYGTQQSVNPYVTVTENGVAGVECGNSLNASGTELPALTETQKLLNSIYTTPAWNQEWIQYLVQTFGKAGSGGVEIYQLDNEPSGWANTHRDIRPVAPTGDEIIQMALLHAPVVKATDSNALVLGPSDYGWQVYNPTSGYSQKYLQAMAAYEQQNGKRILDYFDQHYYPFENDVANQPAGTAATQALRLASTRSLWDPTYVDQSWVNATIALLPTFHGYVDTYYPGTKISITEYNFGGVEDINGALAEADVLGIFAREKLDLATMWGPPTTTQPAAFSFRMFLNYDKSGSTFGETYVQSQSADQSQLAVYSAERACDGSLTLLVINKTGSDITSALSLANFTPAAYAQVYSYSSADLTQIVRQPDMPVLASGFSAKYPANSLTLVVVPAQ